MGDRPGNLSRVRTSEDKVRRKDLCGSVRAVYVLEKLPDVSGPGLVEAGRYKVGERPRGAAAREISAAAVEVSGGDGDGERKKESGGRANG